MISATSRTVPEALLTTNYNKDDCITSTTNFTAAMHDRNQKQNDEDGEDDYDDYDRDYYNYYFLFFYFFLSTLTWWRNLQLLEKLQLRLHHLVNLIPTYGYFGLRGLRVFWGPGKRWESLAPAATRHWMHRRLKHNRSTEMVEAPSSPWKRLADNSSILRLEMSQDHKSSTWTPHEIVKLQVVRLHDNYRLRSAPWRYDWSHLPKQLLSMELWLRLAKQCFDVL